MNLTVLNDWHIGAIRSAGTTPATAYQLRLDLLQQFEDALYDIHTDLLINGDLFDGPDIPKADLLRTFQILSDWLTHADKHLHLSNGNHDLSKSSTVLSSFQFLAALLIETFGPGRVTHIAEPQFICAAGAWVIPHLANQDLFNLALANVPVCDYLFVHANYDNGFAVESDHSLNMSKEQARASPAKFIVFGHEHQARIELGGKVVIVGNQVPSSISDCLNNDYKQLLKIVNGVVELIPTWHAQDLGQEDFSEQDWRDLEDRGRFIRVTGTATAAEADHVVNSIAQLRKSAKALVITNAVKIEGIDDAEELALSHEEVTNFNVLEALLKILTPEEGAIVKSLLEQEHVENPQTAELP